MRISSLVLLCLAACTGRIHPISDYEEGGQQALTSGASVEAWGWSYVAIGSSPASSRSVTMSTLGPNRVLVAIGEMEGSNVAQAISDSAGLTWQPVGQWTQDESNVNEGYTFLSMWAAQAPAQLASDTVTVRFSQTAGAALGVIAVANAGMPIGFVHGSDPTFPTPAFTLSPQPGSILFGGAADVTGDCCFGWAPLANTTLKGGDGYAAGDYGVFWTTGSAPGGAETFGTTKAISASMDWGGIAVEIPAASAPDAGTPDAGTCSWVCQ